MINELPDLIKAGVITQEAADRIREYYQSKESNSGSRMLIAFAILGAILVGLGIILIIAHNWDDLSRSIKTFLAFIPLVIGQALCAYVLLKRSANLAWKEGVAVFLFFAVAASISLVSQIYNIPGNLGTFVLTWMLLGLPLIYILGSSSVSLLYIIGITYYAVDVGYWSQDSPYSYWALLAAALPHYYLLFRRFAHGNFAAFHHWLVPASMAVVLGSFSAGIEELMYVAYCSLFGLFYLFGKMVLPHAHPAVNGFKIIGSLGTVGLLLIVSFNWYWQDVRALSFSFSEMAQSPDFLITAFLSIASVGLLYLLKRMKLLSASNPIPVAFMVMIVAFAIGLHSQVAIIIINVYLLALGALTIQAGARAYHLGRLNFGLSILAVLIACRFFDANLSFIVKGVLFLCVGIAFFATNYWLLQKKANR